MDFVDYLLIAICLIFVYLAVLKFLEKHKNKKDSDPNSKYPHEVLFKYFCMYVLFEAIFFGFGIILGLIFIISAAVLSFVIYKVFYWFDYYRDN